MKLSVFVIIWKKYNYWEASSTSVIKLQYIYSKQHCSQWKISYVILEISSWFEKKKIATNFPTIWIQMKSICAWKIYSMCNVCIIYGNPASTCTAVTLCLYLYSVAGSMWIVVLTSRLSGHLGRAYDCWRGFSEASSEGKADALKFICIIYFLAQCSINFLVRQWNSGEFWYARVKTIHLYWCNLANACVYKKRSNTPSDSSIQKNI